MEYKIGEIFECDGRWYQCLESDGACKGCVGEYEEFIFCKKFNGCTGKIFKELEKVGESYVAHGKVRERYKLSIPLTVTNEIIKRGIECDDTYMTIEIKQDKEDMEKKENSMELKMELKDIKVGNKVTCLSNGKPYVISEVNCRMKFDRAWHDCVIYEPLYENPNKYFVRPIEDFAQKFKLLEDVTEESPKSFNLEAAKMGKPVCTRDGRKVRIICFDCKDETFPIVALVSPSAVREEVISYDEAGYSTTRESEDTLVMAPEKMEGWVNVYNDSPIYKTKEDAEVAASSLKRLIATVKVEWEE